jgi:hypothetical protein
VGWYRHMFWHVSGCLLARLLWRSPPRHRQLWRSIFLRRSRELLEKQTCDLVSITTTNTNAHTQWLLKYNL